MQVDVQSFNNMLMYFPSFCFYFFMCEIGSMFIYRIWMVGVARRFEINV